MPSTKFQAFADPCCNDLAPNKKVATRDRVSKRTRSAAVEARKRSKGSSVETTIPLGALVNGNVVNEASCKGKRSLQDKKKRSSKANDGPVTSGTAQESQITTVVKDGSNSVRVEELRPLTRSKRKSGDAACLKIPSDKKALRRRAAFQPEPNALMESLKCPQAVMFESSPMTRGRRKALTEAETPSIFTIARDDIMVEVGAAIHLTECPKAMLISKAWHTLIAPRICGEVRYKRWLALEMKPRRAQIADSLLDRLINCQSSQVPQGKLTFKMHSILVDWLVDVAIEFRLSNSTLALTSSILDRFLALEDLEKKELQLLGVTCMWLASKMEEVSVPLVSDFAWITYDTYTVDELRAMERRVLNALRFAISRWIPMNYLNLIFELPVVTENPDLKFSIGFLHELVLHEPQLLLIEPDRLAAAICYAAASVVAPALHDKLVSQGTIDYMLMSKHEDLTDLISKIHLLPPKAIEFEHKWTAVLTKYRKPNRNTVACKYFGAPELPEVVLDADAAPV